MESTENETDCCPPTKDTGTCCKVVAIVSVDAKGQMVLPKELREAAGIAPGDKLAITALERDGKVIALCLTPANQLAEMVKTLLEPLMRGPESSKGKE
ncbi:MAG: HgcAB-associated protein [Coprothermobacterota bacterium]|nr:HgcAB-associated protein [Coprothermobacterota bacterium]